MKLDIVLPVLLLKTCRVSSNNTGNTFNVNYFHTHMKINQIGYYYIVIIVLNQHLDTHKKDCSAQLSTGTFKDSW